MEKIMKRLLSIAEINFLIMTNDINLELSDVTNIKHNDNHNFAKIRIEKLLNSKMGMQFSSS